MRLAIISDIHGNLRALEIVLADIESRGADATVNLGDCVTSPLWPRETLELLDALALPTVRGNHDRRIAEEAREKMPPTVAFTSDSLSADQHRSLGALPASLEIDGDIFAVHGTPASDTDYLLEDAVEGRLLPGTAETLGRKIGDRRESLILCGHSHHQHIAHAPGNRLVVNPGSVGCPRYADNKNPFSAESCSPHARYAIATKRNRRWSVELFALAYDWDEVANQARINGFENWATAFLGDQTGAPDIARYADNA
jgi:predicted phosphodiesterase